MTTGHPLAAYSFAISMPSPLEAPCTRTTEPGWNWLVLSLIKVGWFPILKYYMETHEYHLILFAQHQNQQRKHLKKQIALVQDDEVRATLQAQQKQLSQVSVPKSWSLNTVYTSAADTVLQ